MTPISFVVITGLYSGWVQVTIVEAVATPYGLTLLAKLGLVGLLVFLGALNLLWVRPRLSREEEASRWLQRLLVGEAVLAVLVLWLAIASPTLAAEPVPRAAREALSPVTQMIATLVAIAIGSLIIPTLLHDHPAFMRALFFGLIVGSLAIPIRRLERIGPMEIGLMVVFALAAFLLVGLPDREVGDPPLPLVFAFASIAICAMILPGVSGAFLLVVLGIYEPTLLAVRSLDLAYIGVFAAGAVVGLGLFSKLLGWLLEHAHAVTMAALVGLMAGSLRALWPYLEDTRPSTRSGRRCRRSPSRARPGAGSARAGCSEGIGEGSCRPLRNG
jgi:hypothetical protein